MSDSIMDDLRAAASTPAAPEAPPAPAQDTTPAPVAPAVAPAKARDEAGRFAKPVDKPEAREETPAEPTQAQPAAKEGEPKEETKPPPAPAYKPPQSWKPAVREKWATLPPEVQAEVARVEGETQRVLRESAQARRHTESFERMLTPYRAHLAGEPLQVVDGLLRTAVQLQTAPPQHKASLVAQIITSYGVPVDAIADALDGKQAQGSAQQAAPYRDPRVDELLARQQQQEQARARAEALTVQRELEGFAAKAEFLDDVRDRMALLFDEAEAKGETITLEEAYDAACWSNPSIRKILAQREAAAAQSAATASAATQRARAAASSVRSEPAPGIAAQGSRGTPLDDVRAAAESLYSR